MAKTVSPVWVQGHYRWENDDGTLDGSTFSQTQDTSDTIAADAKFRLRISWGESDGQTTATTLTPKLQYNHNGGGYNNVTASSPVQYTTSTSETDGNTSTTGARITAPTGCATFVDATFDENNTVTARAPADQWYEISFQLIIDSAQVSDTDTITFQLVDGAAVETFTTRDATPSLTVSVADTTDDLLANDVESASNVSSPVVGQKQALLANDVQSTSEVSAPVVGQAHALLATSVESTSEVTAPVVNEVNILAANDVESSSEVTVPVIGQVHTLLATSAESSSELTAPVVAQTHALTVNSVESASELTAPALTESNLLLADDIESATEVTVPVVGQAHALLTQSVESSSEVTVPVINQVHALLANAVESSSELTAPVLAEASSTDNLLANDIESASEVTAATVGQQHVLLANDIESAAEVTAPVLAEAGVDVLLANDIESVSTVTSPHINRRKRGGGPGGRRGRKPVRRKKEIIFEIAEEYRKGDLPSYDEQNETIPVRPKIVARSLPKISDSIIREIEQEERKTRVPLKEVKPIRKAAAIKPYIKAKQNKRIIEDKGKAVQKEIQKAEDEDIAIALIFAALR